MTPREIQKLNQSLSINRRIQMSPLNLLKMYVKLFFDFTNFEDFQNKICWIDSERFRLLLCEIILVLFACKHVTSVKSFEAPLCFPLLINDWLSHFLTNYFLIVAFFHIELTFLLVWVNILTFVIIINIKNISTFIMLSDSLKFACLYK